MRLIHKLPETSLLHGHCRYCSAPIVFVPDVGWIDPWPGDTYDMCPYDGDGNGRHRPEVAP